MKTLALIIGQGSIGQRHKLVLEELGVQTRTVSRHLGPQPHNFLDIASALRSEEFNYVVIASETHRHHSDLLQVRESGYRGPVLVEKPLFAGLEDWPSDDPVFVAYNLRFHPALRALKERVQNKTASSVNAYVGQHLSMWRRSRAYEESYSSSRALGGGVLRDLSHELDFLCWIFGPAQSLWTRTSESLGLASEDSAQMLIRFERAPAACVELNRVDHLVQRRLTVNLSNDTFLCDFIGASLRDQKHTQSFSCDANFTYREMHTALLKKDFSSICTLKEALHVNQIIHAAETSAKTEQVVRL